MASVGLFEICTHEHILYMFCKIATTGDDDVTVFTTREMADSIRDDLGDEVQNVRWVLKEGDQGLGEYLAEVEKYCSEDLDVLIMLSMFRGYPKRLRFARFRPQCTQLLWIFSVRRWLEVGFSHRHGIRQNVNLATQRLILRNVDALNVEYPPMADYIDEHLSVSVPVYELVPALFDGEQRRPDETIRFTVPGYVNTDRRDYDLVVDVFETLFEEFGDDIELQLLGTPQGPEGDRIIDRCETLRASGYDVVTYRDWIPNEDYERVARNSSFLISPHRPTVVRGPAEEIYGTTKGSGNVFDSLRTATPLIIPDHFEVDAIVAGSTVTYGDRAELEEILSNTIRDQQRRETLQQRAVENADRFTRERQYKRFSRVVDDMLAG